jgi:4a-hydroxytetrahydrobiopterin dehydratase
MDEIQQQLKSMPCWTLTPEEDHRRRCLSRSFVAKNFEAALDALNAFGAIAEREGHHPDFHLTSYRNVEVVLYTHSLNGLTQNDFALARMFDYEVDVEYSPKWLREHPEVNKEGIHQE